MLRPPFCTCVSRPATLVEKVSGKTWVTKIKSNCPVHFNQYPARVRLSIMVRELTEGE